jgi:MFS family permease
MCAMLTAAMPGCLVLGGRLGDKYGRRNLFLVGAAGFTLASLACAIALSLSLAALVGQMPRRPADQGKLCPAVRKPG